MADAPDPTAPTEPVGDVNPPAEPLPRADRAGLQDLLSDRLDKGWELYKVERLSDDEELVFLRRPDPADPTDPTA